MKFTSVRTLFRLANEEARKQIGIDAVRGVGPLRMIRRKVDSATPAAGLGAGTSSTGHLCSTEVVGNTVTTTELLWNTLFRYQAYMVRSPHIEPTGFPAGGVRSGDNVGPGAFARSASCGVQERFVTEGVTPQFPPQRHE